MMFCTGNAAGRDGDVVVLGAGPAGLALATELGARGVRVTCVAPEPGAAWRPNYGVWLDDLGPLHVAACVRHVWRRPFVQLDPSRRVVLERAYGLLDNDLVQAHFFELLEQQGARVVVGAAREVEHHDTGSRVTLRDGTTLPAALVVDATGSQSGLVRRPPRRPAFQAAYGELVRVRRHWFAADEMPLMDFRGDGAPPTFLYALPLAPDRVFVEETCLAGRPPLSQSVLRAKLHARIARMGLEVLEVLEREVCVIPMGEGIPLGDQRTVAFGAAGAFVHPATGYQVGRALRLAAPTAAAIVAGLGAEGPAAAARRAYRVMWPSASRRAWELYTFGMEVLCDYDAAQLRSFMGAFFELPPATWSGYMSGTLSPAAITSAMARVFVNADSELRWTLLGASARPAGRPLWRALLPGGVA